MIETEKNSDTLYRIYYIFTESVLTTYTSYTSDEKNKIQEFIIDFARNYTPYGLLKIDTVSDIVEHVFTVDANRDFVWKLIFNFYSTAGMSQEESELLYQALGTALDVTDNTSEENLTLTPIELKQRSLDSESIYQYLKNNKWLTVLVMILLLYRRSFGENKNSIQTFIEKDK